MKHIRFSSAPRACALSLSTLAAVTSFAFAQPDWTKLTPLPGPSPRFFSHAVAERARILLFAGGTRANYNINNDTWEWRLGAWRQLRPVWSPPGRSAHQLVYDSVRGKTVLFGGYDGTNPLGDLWEFDGTNWRPWHTTTSPSARFGHTMVFDPIRKLTYLFGGLDVGRYRNDTWSFDGKDWKFVPTTVVPPARAYHAMAWDDITGRSMIFGGYGATVFADAWAFDGTNWASMPGGPPRRFGSAMTWDDTRKRVVLHGGWGAPSADTWDWDGVQWTIRDVVTTPIQLGYATMAYDRLSRQVVRLMGESLTSRGVVYDDVWAFKTSALASEQVFGSPCKGSASTPLASGGNLAWIGETATFDCTQAPKNSAVILGLGFSNTVWGALSLPFDLKPFGASGCALSIALGVTGVVATNGAGEASAAVPIPKDKTLAGAKFYVQFLVPDAAANTFGMTTTNGVEATVGIL